MKSALTALDHAALAAFARLFGRTWRRELAKRWENGTLLLSQVPVSEEELARLVTLKGKLRPSGLTRYKAPAYVVETRVDGLPWAAAYVPNERAPEHATPAEALARIEQLLSLDDPTWRRAEYRIVATTGLPKKSGPMRCACGRLVMLARRGKGQFLLDVVPEGQPHGRFVLFQGAAIPDADPANLPADTTWYREHACSRPGEAGRP
jgi:hypothetical protein